MLTFVKMCKKKKIIISCRCVIQMTKINLFSEAARHFNLKINLKMPVVLQSTRIKQAYTTEESNRVSFY